MPLIAIGRSATRLVLIAAVALSAPALIDSPINAAYAGKDDEGSGKKKKGVFSKIGSSIKKALPTRKDQPSRATSSSSSSSSSRPRTISRVDGRSNLVPISAAEEREAREFLENRQLGGLENPPIRGYYEAGYEPNLLSTDGRNASRGKPGEPVGPETQITEELLNRLALSSLREEAVGSNASASDLDTLHANNQALIKDGYTVLPTTAQMLAMREFVENTKNGISVSEGTTEIIQRYLEKNQQETDSIRARYDGERSRSRLGGQEDIDRATSFFGAADADAYPAQENAASAVSQTTNGAYDLPGAPLDYDDDRQDDNSESSEPPPAPDEI